MENEIRQSIIKTVLYSDIFDYPLTSEQVWKFLLSQKKIKRRDFKKVLDTIKMPIIEKNGWYFLRGREKILQKRTERKKESDRKLEIAKAVSKVLSAVPSVLLIAISGGVSVDNADKNDDIDFFIVTKANSLWQSRLMLILLLKIMGKHRSRKGRKVADKICLNMLMDEKNLSFSKDRQDLYTAHEILQLRPIFSRDKTYEKLISKNLWVKKYMPNAIEEINIKGARIKNRKQPVIIKYLLLATEFLVKEIQLWYIKRHIGQETVTKGMLAFHPVDHKKEIMKSFEQKLKRYG